MSAKLGEGDKIEAAPTSPSEDDQARSELQEYLEVSQEHHALFPRAALVGLCAGSVAVIFRGLLFGADTVRNALVIWSHNLPALGWLLPMLYSAAGAVLSVTLMRRYAPETSGSGIPHLKGVLHRLRDLSWFRVLIVKMFGGVLAIGSGLALGREGPTVQMGGAVGKGVAGWLKVSSRDGLTLTAAGAGAGLAAAFNAPLSGLIFVLEEVQRDFRPAVFGAAFIAAAAADVVARLASGQLPVFAVPDFPAPPLSALPAFAILGCVAGAAGIVFNRSLLKTLDWMAGFHARASLCVVASIGAACGLVAWFSQLAVGGGHKLAEVVMAGNLTLLEIPLWFLLRFGLTVFSYGTGAAGGIFAPMLVLGALIGLGTGRIAHIFFPSAASQPGVFAVVGMAAYFTAIVRAPLTGVILILEMTGNYEQMLSLLVSCFCAYAVAEYLKDVPIYEALLKRDLMRGGVQTNPQTPLVVEFAIEAGAPFAGREVRELGLPSGCILVRCYDDGHESIPTASTRLSAHTRITAMISPEAIASLQLLRQGCAAKHE
jgi:CIC family chloride channel protein